MYNRGMAKLITSKRVALPKGKQKELINKILAKVSIEKAAQICGLSERTIRDWRREKFLVDFGSIKKLCQKSRISFPSNFKVKERYWYASKGAFDGWKAVIKKYGKIPSDPEYRKRRWYEWWERDGCHRKEGITVAKLIRSPPCSKELAEFAGILLGDGCISRRQIAITLHHIDDKAYGRYVVSLIKRLFHVPVAAYHSRKDSVIDFVVSRSELVKYCNKKLGLKTGNKAKQQVDIPQWIKENKNYLTACIRGLVDTDGCVFQHKYKVKNKWFYYKKLSFSNRSKPLIDSVFNFLKRLNMSPRITKDGKDVRLESKRDLKLYFSIVNSHNPKYLKKYKN